jgi:hypothetical protein
MPAAERPPKGLDAHWRAIWRRALKTLREQDTWAPEQRPLLDEYVFALRGAQDARRGFAWLDHLETVASADMDWAALAQIATGLPVQWDRHTKRASALADQLLLTPRGRKAAARATTDDDSTDAFDALGSDELAPRRRRKTTR